MQTGDFAIVEYTYGQNPSTFENPVNMESLRSENDFRYVTNFYYSDNMARRPEGKMYSTHGLDRYNTLKGNDIQNYSQVIC